MFVPAEIYPAATGLICFSLDKKSDDDSVYPYRVAASFTAPAKPVPVANFYQQLLRARGISVSVRLDDVNVQVIEGLLPGTGTMLHIAVGSWAEVTRVFMAAHASKTVD